MISRLTVFIFWLALPLFPETGGTMTSDAQKFFTEHYENPVIEKHPGEHHTVFPSLSLYSVFEKANLVEDPLVPDIWIRTGTGTFYPSDSIEQALREDRIVPKNRKEALAFAPEIVHIKHGCYYMIAGNDSFDGIIPDVYNGEKFFPSVKETASGYVVRVYFYYPDKRYAEFFSLYRNNLVEYIVSCDKTGYTVTTGRVYHDGNDADEAKLHEIMIDHIQDRALLNDLGDFLDKRSLYGITDPPDYALVEQRIAELSGLWEQAFVVKHPELHFLAKKVLERNPEFRFESDTLYEKTKDLNNTRTIEYYRSTLEAILQEIVQRCGQ